MISRTFTPSHLNRMLLALVLVAWMIPLEAENLITNAGTGVRELTLNEARLYMTMRLTEWPNGTPVRVFVLPDNNSRHIRVSKTVLGLYPYQLRRAWDRQVFSGTGQAPTTLSDEHEMLERVASTPGAIGYSSTVPKNSEILSVEVR